MAPHSARFTSFFAGLGDVQVHRDAAVFVGLNGDGLDTARPPLKCVFIEVAGPVIWMDARSVEDFRAEVIAQTSKTSLVEHECCTLLSVDALGLQVSEQVIGRYVFVEDIWSEASEKGMAVFFGGGNEDDIGGRPEPYGVFVGDEGCSQASPRAWVRGLEVDRPSAVELVVAVHGVAAAESDEHRFGPTCHAQHLMAENQRISLDCMSEGKGHSPSSMTLPTSAFPILSAARRISGPSGITCREPSHVLKGCLVRNSFFTQ